VSFYTTGSIIALLGTVSPGGQGQRITQAGNRRITQSGGNLRIVQSGTSSTTIVTATASASSVGSAAVEGASSFMPPVPGLLAWWQFNETSGTTAADSGDSHPGTTVGSPTFEAGRDGNAIRLSGTGQYVDCGNVAEFMGLNRSYTCWCFCDSDVGPHTIGAKVSTDGTQGVMLRTNNTAIEVFIDGATAKISVAGAVSSPGWQHIALVLDNASGPPYTARLYKDAVQIGTGSYTTVTDPTTVNFQVGRQGGLTTRDFDGLIDEFRIYNYPLSQAEINMLAGGGGGPVGNLEAINPSAVGVENAVDSTARQTWLGFGFGLSVTDNVSSLVSAHLPQLFGELKTKVLRLNDPSYVTNGTEFIANCKDTVLTGMANGVDIVLATGYFKRKGITPTELAGFVKAAIDAGMPITHVSAQNEPDGNVLNAMDDSEVVPAYQELRLALNNLGLSAIKLIGIEWAHFGGHGQTEYNNLDAASMIPSSVAYGAGHCYRDCPTPGVYDQRWMTKGIGLWSTETGNMGVPHFGARIIAGLNHGSVVESAHQGQSTGIDDQTLVQGSGARNPWHGQARVINYPLNRDAIFRRVHSDDRPADVTAASADVMLRPCGSVPGGGIRNPRIQSACFRNSDGRWGFACCNATNGAGAVTSGIDACYPAALIQVTVTIPEMAGVNTVWTTERCSSAGTITTGGTVNMQNGMMRFTLAERETIGMISSSTSNWLMVSGTWSDIGFWDDTAAWNDG
jgi:Concanavalin A-like lectin/glucanases superfamily